MLVVTNTILGVFFDWLTTLVRIYYLNLLWKIWTETLFVDWLDGKCCLVSDWLGDTHCWISYRALWREQILLRTWYIPDAQLLDYWRLPNHDGACESGARESSTQPCADTWRKWEFRSTLRHVALNLMLLEITRLCWLPPPLLALLARVIPLSSYWAWRSARNHISLAYCRCRRLPGWHPEVFRVDELAQPVVSGISINTRWFRYYPASENEFILFMQILRCEKMETTCEMKWVWQSSCNDPVSSRQLS